MRLGGPIFQKYDDPASWEEAVRARGFRATSCPVSPFARFAGRLKIT